MNFINYKSEIFDVISDKLLAEIVHNDRSLTFMVMNTSFSLSSPCGWMNIDPSRNHIFSKILL